VIDRDTRDAVGGVEVVLRGDRGDVTTRTSPGGTFSIELPRGRYHAFVRDARVMSTGLQPRTRLRSAPGPALAGAVDTGLMPVLDVDDAIENLELTVTAGATIRGTVVDSDGALTSGVVVSAQQQVRPMMRAPGLPSSVPTLARRNTSRPVLGTDVAITDAKGHFELRVPAGSYNLVGNHPRFAGVSDATLLDLSAGDSEDVTLGLAHGCEITGKIVSADGSPVQDGALESQAAFNMDLSFGPTGRIAEDGTFRWTTLVSGPVDLRAWPWHQPASPARTFDCNDGTRIDNVVLTIPVAAPDLAGTVSDAAGQRVPLVYLDVASLVDTIHGQQERSDAGGGWEVYAMPAGRYQISASARGRGYVQETVTSPRRNIELKLSGTGRLSGTTTDLVDGSFELTFHYCGAGANPVELEDEARLVVVRGGHFVVDAVPACTLAYSVRWRDTWLAQSAVVEPGRTAYIEIPLGEPRVKQVHGLVRDADGKPVANARVTAVVDNSEAVTVRSDDSGRFTLKTHAGAQLVAGNGIRVGRGTVGRANITEERVDLVLDGDAQ